MSERAESVASLINFSRSNIGRGLLSRQGSVVSRQGSLGMSNRSRENSVNGQNALNGQNTANNGQNSSEEWTVPDAKPQVQLGGVFTNEKRTRPKLLKNYSLPTLQGCCVSERYLIHFLTLVL